MANTPSAESIAYARAIRNPRKRAYAQAILSAIREGQEWPDYPRELSYMAAQSVHMAMRATEPAYRLDAIRPNGIVAESRGVARYSDVEPTANELRRGPSATNADGLRPSASQSSIPSGT